uniref:Uncharacterized protein n=1 Tax=Meloidogyne enterolobii TaxID=390850 RepID=A0A6V7WTX6_MELEN|nr:unnamed protein product [Meloidogyne enterolobii]
MLAMPNPITIDNGYNQQHNSHEPHEESDRSHPRSFRRKMKIRRLQFCARIDR